MPALKFRVLLDSESKEEVFRDILINDGDSFETLYKTILTAFNFQGEQMASFYVSNEDWDKGHEITLMDMSFNEDDSVPSLMNNTMIRQHIEAPNQKLILVHDFLNMWIFLIELLGIEKNPVSMAQVVLKVGEAPDENSKGDIDNVDLQFTSEKMDANHYLEGFDDFDEDLDEYSEQEFDNIDDLDI
jgi:hypothetical protein